MVMVYSDEVRTEVVALAAAGESPRALADQFGPSESTIRRWLRESTDVPVRSNLEAAETDDVGKIRRRHLLTLARAIDENPGSPGLHAEYRAVYKELVDDGSSFPDTVAELFGTEVRN